MPSAAQTMVIHDDRLGSTVKEVEKEFRQMNAGRQVATLGGVFRNWRGSIVFQVDYTEQVLPGQRNASEQEMSGVKIALANIRHALAVLRQGNQDPAKWNQALESLGQSVQSLQATGAISAAQASNSQAGAGQTIHFRGQLADGHSAPVYGDFVANDYQGTYNRPPTSFTNNVATGYSTPLYGNKYGGVDPYDKLKEVKK